MRMWRCRASTSCVVPDESLYVGHTSDLERRLAQHNEGRGGRFTKARLPVALVYSEQVDGPAAAVDRERQIKRWTKSKKVALVTGNRGRLKSLARRRHRWGSQTHNSPEFQNHSA